MNSNKDIYFVLQFTVVCYVIFLLSAVLQSRSRKGSCLFGVLKDVKSHGHLPFLVCILIVDRPLGVSVLRCVTLDTTHCLLR